MTRSLWPAPTDDTVAPGEQHVENYRLVRHDRKIAFQASSWVILGTAVPNSNTIFNQLLSACK